MHPMISYFTVWTILILAASWVSPASSAWVFGGSGIILLLGLFSTTVERLISRLIQPFLLFAALRDLLVAWITRMQTAVSNLRRERGLTEASVLYSRVSGFVLILVLSIIVFLAEIYLVSESARGLISDGVSAHLPILSDLENYMDWMVGVTVGSGALLWGIYLSDAKRHSNLTSIHDLPAEQRKWIQIKAALLLGLFLFLLVGFAIYRGFSFLPDAGMGVAQEPAESMAFDYDALSMNNENTTRILPPDDSMQSLFVAYLPMGIQIVLAVVTFFTVQLSEWLLECFAAFTVMLSIKLVQGILWIIWGPVSLIHKILSWVASSVLACFEFIARISIPITAPLAAQLGPQYVDDGQAYLSSLKTTRHGSVEGAENTQDQAETERTQEAVDFGNRQAHLESENTSSNNSKEDNDEPDMIVSGDPDEEKSSHNWSPFKK